MRDHRLPGFATLAVAALVLSGCTTETSRIVVGSSVDIGSTVAFTSMNPQSRGGETETNLAVAAATGSRFYDFDEEAEVVFNPSFGTVEKLSDDPLVVRYTVADGVRWSDGVAVDGADLLLNWAALSGVFNDPDLTRANVFEGDAAEYSTDFDDGAVYFDTGVDPERPRGIQLARATPQLSEDRKSITMTYSAPFADWALAMPSAGSPAHVVAGGALDIDGSDQAKDAVIAAVTEGDTGAMASLARFWNTGFAVTDPPEDASVLVTNGPYLIEDFIPEQFVRLAPNPNYGGAHRPEFEAVTFRYFRDPLAAIQGLNNGAIQVATPPLTPEVVAALDALRLDTAAGISQRFEHLDLKVSESKSGAFDDIRVREAFLKVVPREEIASALASDTDAAVGLRNSFLFQPGEDGYAAASKVGREAIAENPDVAGAVALLAEAGVAAPEVCILYPSDDALRAREFAAIQQAAAPAGFVVTDCSSPDWQDRLGGAGEYDAALFAWNPRIPGVSELEQIYSTGGYENLIGYSNAEVDELFAQIAATADPVERRELRLQADALILADHIGLPLYNFPSVTAFDDKHIAGIAPSPSSAGPYWNVWAWNVVLPN